MAIVCSAFSILNDTLSILPCCYRIIIVIFANAYCHSGLAVPQSTFDLPPVGCFYNVRLILWLLCLKLSWHPRTLGHLGTGPVHLLASLPLYQLGSWQKEEFIPDGSDKEILMKVGIKWGQGGATGTGREQGRNAASFSSLYPSPVSVSHWLNPAVGQRPVGSGWMIHRDQCMAQKDRVDLGVHGGVHRWRSRSTPLLTRYCP